MRKLLVLFALLASIPVLVFAQAQPPAPGPMQQQETLHKQFRAKILGLLTPAHRNLLALLAGQLAISANPDPHAVIQKLDAALSSSEKQAILNAAQSFMLQERAFHQQMMAKFRAANPNMPSPRPMPSGGERMHRTPDPGALLFMIATGEGHGPRMMGPRGGFPNHPWPPSPNP
jgi:hypothetical protein